MPLLSLFDYVLKHFRSSAQVRGRLFVSGSFRLGILTRGIDIDVACVAPRSVDSNDFFGPLCARLAAVPGMVKLKPLKGAGVPIIEVQSLLFDRMGSHTRLHTCLSPECRSAAAASRDARWLPRQLLSVY